MITYCGGGIAAAATLFALHVAGHDKQLYDTSLLGVVGTPGPAHGKRQNLEGAADPFQHPGFGTPRC